MNQHTITIGNKKYPYYLNLVPKTNKIKFKCEAAKINQELLQEDIGKLLLDLPQIILEELEFEEKQDQTIRFRVSISDKKKIMKNAFKNGYNNISGYLRDVGLNQK
jgi:seryl-tRNA synthetase